ncbi:hypothetical protein CRUP_038240 [Coryphaenoides rupestris]|nr:hypothetical protein CRUP_038240 [Coryphaenoides rupestris]
MLHYIRDKTAVPYFSNLVWFIGSHVIELDKCVQTDEEHRNRGKLSDLVFLIIHYRPLVNSLAEVVLNGDLSVFTPHMDAHSAHKNTASGAGGVRRFSKPSETLERSLELSRQRGRQRAQKRPNYKNLGEGGEEDESETATATAEDRTGTGGGAEEGGWEDDVRGGGERERGKGTDGGGGGGGGSSKPGRASGEQAEGINGALLERLQLLVPQQGRSSYSLGEEIFLDMFEDEYRSMTAIRVFFMLRSLSLQLQGEPETQLPLTRPEDLIKADDVLDLNNSDLIACMVVSKDGGQAQRFLAVDVYQMSLVEPETKRLGWGVVKFAGLLQLPVQLGGADVLGFAQTAHASPSGLPFRFYEQSRRAPNDPTASRSLFASVDKVPGFAVAHCVSQHSPSPLSSPSPPSSSGSGSTDDSTFLEHTPPSSSGGEGDAEVEGGAAAAAGSFSSSPHHPHPHQQQQQQHWALAPSLTPASQPTISLLTDSGGASDASLGVESLTLLPPAASPLLHPPCSPAPGPLHALRGPSTPIAEEEEEEEQQEQQEEQEGREADGSSSGPAENQAPGEDSDPNPLADFQQAEHVDVTPVECLQETGGGGEDDTEEEIHSQPEEVTLDSPELD